MFGGYLLQTAAGLVLGSLVFAGDNLGLVAAQAVLFGGLLVVSFSASCGSSSSETTPRWWPKTTRRRCR